MGIILMLLVYFAKYIEVKKHSKISILKYLLLPLALIFTYTCINIILKQKMIYGSVSYSVRNYDISTGIKLFLQKPIFGWGFNNIQIMFNQDVSRGNSNGLLSLLYQLGLFGCSIYLIPLGIYLKNNYKHMFAYVIIIFFIVSTINEPIQYTPLILVLLSYYLLY